MASFLTLELDQNFISGGDRSEQYDDFQFYSGTEKKMKQKIYAPAHYAFLIGSLLRLVQPPPQIIQWFKFAGTT